VALRKSIAEPCDLAPASSDWQRGLPEVGDGTVTLRELAASDASSLVAHLNHAPVLRYIAPCPSTAAGFCRFIRWAHTQRRRGALACYGIVPAGETRAVGVIEVWPLERDFSTAEWGFALGESFWGRGLFVRSAQLALDVVFSRLGVYRLEARAVDINRRGNRVLEKLSATREGVLRGGFHDGAMVRDHVMWSILAPEWRTLRGQARDAH
jgi:RimJ/RimL family protein N-acetyltransferase